MAMMVSALPSEFETTYFSWKAALTSNFDVFHVHWPESLVRDKSGIRRALKIALFGIFMARLRLKKTPIVRTVHNIEPHEPADRIERWLLDRLDKRVALWVNLNDSTPSPHVNKTVTILHGHYKDRYSALDRTLPTPGRILYFGQIRPYKGVEALIAEFLETDRAGMSLRLVGRPSEDRTRVRLERAIAGDDRVRASFRHVEESELAREILEAELVVLPYRNLHNSGSLLLALSLDRPVLAPNTDTVRELRSEVGDDWVFTYEGELTSKALENAAERVHLREVVSSPDLSRRDWPSLGRQLADVYYSVCAVRG